MFVLSKMEIKGILEKIRQKEPKKEFLFALEIGHEIVKSAIWGIMDNEVKVMAIGETFSWEKEEELVQAVDMTLSSVAQKFVPQQELVEPNKVVLGLPADWVEQDKIVAEKNHLIKKISQELELNPIGFVLINEAIIHYLKTNEGVPPTAIVVGLGIKRLTVCLVKLGKTIGVQSVKRSDNLGADLNEGLSRFTNQEVFPARILIYGKEKLEEARQELMNYSWPKEVVNFLHLPKVEILAPDFDIQAIVLAGGKEISKGQVQNFSTAKEEKEEKIEEKVVENKEELMGFIEGKDVAEEPRRVVEKEEKQPEVIPEETPKAKIPKIPRLNFASFFAPFLARFKKLALPSLPKPRIKFNFSSRLVMIGGILLALLVILIGLALIFWWYMPKAQINLYIKPQALEKDFLVKLDPSIQVADNEKLILPAQKQEVIVEGEKTSVTTGSKIVGDPAKGKVTIFKVPGAEKKFSAGTLITSSSGIKFTLDEEVLIASRSSAADPTPSAIAAVTAEKIGPEGNLASGAEFSIANFAKSDYVAKNESAFAGGTSREIQAVSKKDQDKLVEDLTNELKKKATEELKTKIESQYKPVEESLTTKVMEKSFSKEVEAEADEVSLKMKIKVLALSYSESDFTKMIQEQIEKSIPEGLEYKPEESETKFVLKEVTKDGMAIFSAQYKTNLIPKLDLEAIKKNLSGKYLDIGKSYLTSLPAVNSVEVKITPSLPMMINVFPRMIKNIRIEVVVE